jgi:hypothetical protein
MHRICVQKSAYDQISSFDSAHVNSNDVTKMWYITGATHDRMKEEGKGEANACTATIYRKYELRPILMVEVVCEVDLS